jgi:hypothetical protein
VFEVCAMSEECRLFEIMGLITIGKYIVSCSAEDSDISDNFPTLLRRHWRHKFEKQPRNKISSLKAVHLSFCA